MEGRRDRRIELFKQKHREGSINLQKLCIGEQSRVVRAQCLLEQGELAKEEDKAKGGWNPIAMGLQGHPRDFS